MEFATAIEKRPTLNLQFCLLAPLGLKVTGSGASHWAFMLR